MTTHHKDCNYLKQGQGVVPDAVLVTLLEEREALRTENEVLKGQNGMLERLLIQYLKMFMDRA